MSIAYIFNGFGGYEERDSRKGWVIKFAGKEFFFPFGEVTALPDMQMRELDHDKSTGGAGGAGELTYQLVFMPGHRIANELLNTQIPSTNRELGIIQIKGKATGKSISVSAGFDLEGNHIVVDVPEMEPTNAEKSEAAQLADRYKNNVVQSYLQSKRERMLGGPGQKFPDRITALFMDELGIEDVDDVSAHKKAVAGLDPATLEVILRSFAANKQDLEQAVESVRKGGNAQVAKGRAKPQNLAAHAAKFDAEQAEKVGKE